MGVLVRCLVTFCALPAMSGCAPAPEVEPDATVLRIGRLYSGLPVEPIENAVLVLREGRVAAVGREGEVLTPPGARQVDFSGRAVVPGLINSHGHVGMTMGLESGAGFFTRDNILSQLRLYALYGVTSVLSLGESETGEGIAVRNEQEREGLGRARLFVAGPVVTGQEPDDVRRQVRELAEAGVDFVKIRVDDNLGATVKMPPEAYRAVIDEAHRHGLPVAAHIYYLEDAKDLLREGVDLIAHSVRDREIDQEFIDLLKERDVCLCPTLTREVSTFIYGNTPDFFEDPFFVRSADPDVLEQLNDPERQAAIRRSPTAQHYREALRMAQKNLARLVESGVRIAFGTDSGPPARFQGYFEHLELELMQASGLSPSQILFSATGAAAACLGLKDLGTLEPGKWADFLVLMEDPGSDVRRLRGMESVWIGGREFSAALE